MLKDVWEIIRQTTDVEVQERNGRQWIQDCWDALGKIHGYSMSVAFDRLEGEVTLRRGYLSNKGV